jgi:hypothetical protein
MRKRVLAILGGVAIVAFTLALVPNDVIRPAILTP